MKDTSKPRVRALRLKILSEASRSSCAFTALQRAALRQLSAVHRSASIVQSEAVPGRPTVRSRSYSHCASRFGKAATIEFRRCLASLPHRSNGRYPTKLTAADLRLGLNSSSHLQVQDVKLECSGSRRKSPLFLWGSEPQPALVPPVFGQPFFQRMEMDLRIFATEFRDIRLKPVPVQPAEHRVKIA